MIKDVTGRGFLETLKIDDAWKQFSEQAKIQVLEAEDVLLDNCLRRVTASDIIANINIPPFNRSAMDGYAVRAVDTFDATSSSPITFTLIGNVDISQTCGLKIKEREAVRVATGAALPKNADSVVMLEYTEPIENNKIAVYKSVTPGSNVSKIGEDVKKGKNILLKGTVLRPQDIALLAALGIEYVKVRCKPRVAIFSTGDELVDVGKKLSDNKIYDVNRYFMLSAVKDYGGICVDFGIVKDDVNTIKTAINDAASKADLILVSGGTSVGLKDLVPQALASLDNSKIIVHGVSMKPGKPVALGMCKGKPIVILPGNPVATIIAFHVFVKKILSVLMDVRANQFENVIIKAKLARRISSTPGTRDFIRVSLSKVEGEIIAEPMRISGSSRISSIVDADGLIAISEDVEGIEKDEIVDIILL